MSSEYRGRHAAKRHRGRRALALIATSGMLAVASASGAFADIVSLDGDTADTGGSPAVFSLANGNCAAGDTVAGAITIKYNGAASQDNQHFNASETLAVNFFVPSGSGLSAAVDSSPVTMPATWTSSSPDLVIPFTTTLGASTADNTYQIGVSVVGTDYAVGQSEGNGRPQYGVTVDCVADTTGGGNTPPIVDAGGPYTGNEGSAVSLSTATASDVDSDPLTYSWTYADAAGASNPAGSSCSFGDASALNTSVTCNDNGHWTLTLSVSDGVNPAVTDTADLQVSNVAPTVGTLTLGGATGTACTAGNAVTLDFGFTDPGTSDNPWAVDINWGDGSSDTTYNASTQGTQTQQSHTYGAGSFTIGVSVTDKDSGVGTASSGAGAVSHLYNMSGILAPFNADGSSVWKYGSTVPVKVKITDCNSAPVSGLAPTVGTTLQASTSPTVSIDETASTSAADTTGVMRYDPTAGQYIYNFGTKYLTDPSATYYMTVKGTDSNGHIVTSPAVVQQKFGLKSK